MIRSCTAQRVSFLTTGIACAVGLVIVLYNHVTHSTHWVSDIQLLVAGTFCRMSMVPKFFPDVVRANRLFMWYSWMMLCSAVSIAGTQSSVTSFMYSSTTIFGFHILHTVVYQIRVPTVACWQFIYLVVAIYSYSKVPDQGPHDLRLFTTFEISTSIFLVFLASSTAKLAWALASQEVKTAMLQGSSTAMSTLLDLVCDMSFELDANLNFKDDVPKFSAMMMMMASTASIQGLPLTSFMTFEDNAELFTQRLHDTGSGSGSAAGLQRVKLRDSLGNHVDTEVFYVRYDNIGTASFLIGLRECGEHPIGELKSFQKQRARGKSGRQVASAGSPANVLAIAIGRSEESADPCAECPKDIDDTTECQSDGDSGSESDTASYSSSSYSSTAFPLDASIVSPARATDTRAMWLSVRIAMQRWVLREDRRSACCPFHDAVLELEMIVLAFNGFRCSSTFRPTGMEQCLRCGILSCPEEAKHTSKCGICRHPKSNRSSHPLVDLGASRLVQYL
mmetsp:Transcript_97470/g.314089  ORF Transcript_97470/g.314089 Transcript_97470/m.314089 type:complete len:506 (-) Transcript_97470:165-1682(-)